MQNQHLKLREIIWEITGKCHNNCSYCGSKKVHAKEPSRETIIDIAKEIAKYPPCEIDISGGDPLTLPFDLHKDVISILKGKEDSLDIAAKEGGTGTICKILCNPKTLHRDIESIKVLELYDWIGISINTKDELDKFVDLISSKNKNVIMTWNPLKKCTIITNFNIANLYDYDIFEAFVRKYSLPWTIQYTVYEDENNEFAIYNNQSALEQLSRRVNQSIRNGVKVIISDNARNDNGCGAGLVSMGLTYDGDVIPCLSMRSWCNPVGKKTPNILKTTLETIWRDSFKEQRFGEFKCCKDACKNKVINIEKIIIIPDIQKEENDTSEDIRKKVEEWIKKEKKIKTNPYDNIPGMPNMPYAVMYAATPWPDGGTGGMPRVTYYGVVGDNQVYAYAVNYLGNATICDGTVLFNDLDINKGTTYKKTNLFTDSTTNEEK